MKPRAFLSAGLMFLVLILLSFPARAVPLVIQFQGKLTNASGRPVTDPAVSMVFRIYDVDTDGSPLWAEEQTVEVQRGIYTVGLGTGTTIEGSFGAWLFSSDSLWLEVLINGEVLMPRVQLTSVAYAMKAAKAEDSETLGGNASSYYATSDHPHAFSDLSGEAADSQVPDLITRDSELSAGLADKADEVHEHSGAAITSGTVAEAYIDSAITRDSEIMPEVLASGGPGSGLHADLLDGLDATSFLRRDTADTYTGGQITFNPGTKLHTNGALDFSGANLVVGLGDSDADRVKVTGDLLVVYGANDTATLDSSAAMLILGYGTASVAGQAGDLVLKAATGSTSAYIDGETGILYLGYGSASTPGNEGEIILDDDNGEPSIRIDGGNSTLYIGYGSQTTPGDGGMINLYDDSGTRTSYVSGQSGQFFGRMMLLEESNGANVLNATTTGVHIGDSQSPNDVDFKIWDPSIGDEALWFNASAASLSIGSGSASVTGDDGDLYVRDSSGTINISMDGATGTTTTKILTITGGSDLSEQFEIKGLDEKILPKPGMVVSIDAERPGELVVSSRAYDRTVAGVVSGAGGIHTGVVMGQSGTEAEGTYPVALTGRVYVMADASYGHIQPGDLLTTAETPGHVMKVTDYKRAQGATIGKAMSPLSQGRGLVLALVSMQ